MFNFECLNILMTTVGHPSQKSWPFEFVGRFCVQFRMFAYIMGRNRTSVSKVMAV